MRTVPRAGRWALVTIGTAFFLAELGDKTMLATVTLAATEEPIGTWLGSTAGMVAGDAIAIAIGALLGTRLPERAIAIFAAGAFEVFGAIGPRQTVGSGMISRTSCAHRQATAILAAHSSASSREGTSTIENPPMTALVSGYGPAVTVPSVATTLAR